MWNYILNYQGVNGWDWNHSAYVVNQGHATLTNTNRATGEKPFYQVDVPGRDPKIAQRIWSRIIAPARTAGQASGYWDYLDPVADSGTPGATAPASDECARPPSSTTTPPTRRSAGGFLR
jgi:hypothetical protein